MWGEVGEEIFIHMGVITVIILIFNVNSQLRSIVIPITSIWKQETSNFKTDVIILHMEGNINYVNCQLCICKY